MNSKIKKIEALCLDHDIEIVSFGLSPNPNGFCYETPERPINKKVLIKLDELLDSLNSEETLIMRRYYFGGGS